MHSTVPCCSVRCFGQNGVVMGYFGQKEVHWVLYGCYSVVMDNGSILVEGEEDSAYDLYLVEDRQNHPPHPPHMTYILWRIAKIILHILPNRRMRGWNVGYVCVLPPTCLICGGCGGQCVEDKSSSTIILHIILHTSVPPFYETYPLFHETYPCLGVFVDKWYTILVYSFLFTTFLTIKREREGGRGRCGGCGGCGG